LPPVEPFISTNFDFLERSSLGSRFIISVRQQKTTNTNQKRKEA